MIEVVLLLQQVWDELVSDSELKKYKFKIKQQVLGYQLDFYCPDVLVAIALDQDEKRGSYLHSVGIEVLVLDIDNSDILPPVKNVLLPVIEKQQYRLGVLDGGVFGV